MFLSFYSSTNQTNIISIELVFQLRIVKMSTCASSHSFNLELKGISNDLFNVLNVLLLPQLFVVFFCHFGYCACVHIDSFKTCEEKYDHLLYANDSDVRSDQTI